jgi:hypothetical protein
MGKIIAFCGIDCAGCPAFIAKKENNDELRKKTAEQWSKQFNATIPPESVNCDGCIAPDGLHIGYCDVCEIRKCALGNQVENCACCDDYGCEKIEKWLKNAPEAKKNLEEIRARRR